VQGVVKFDCVTECFKPEGKKKVTTVPFEAVKLFGLYVNTPPGKTSTLMFPDVDGGADGMEAGAVLVALEELLPAGGA